MINKEIAQQLKTKYFNDLVNLAFLIKRSNVNSNNKDNLLTNDGEKNEIVDLNHIKLMFHQIMSAPDNENEMPDPNITYIFNILHGLESIANGMENLLPLTTSKPADAKAFTLQLINNGQLEDLIAKFCEPGSTLKEKLNEFVREEAFIRQVLFYRSKTHLFSVKFPNQQLRNEFINSFTNKWFLQTFDRLNKDTVFIEFNPNAANEVLFPRQAARDQFINLLNLDNNPVFVKREEHFLTINDLAICDKTKNIAINLPADIKKREEFKKAESAKKSSENLALTVNHYFYFNQWQAKIVRNANPEIEQCITQSFKA